MRYDSIGRVMIPQLIFSAAALVTTGFMSHAQEPTVSCPTTIEYGNRNQIDPKPLTIKGILLGRVIVEVGDPAKVIGAAPACIGLFTDKDHRLVASAVADEDGRFKFSPVPAGSYRLVVRDPQNVLCIANVPLRVVESPSKAAKSLVIHMRAAGVDKCSYGDFK